MKKTSRCLSILKFLSGPVLFFAVKMINFGTLSSEGASVIALYAWIIAWWIAKPVPWAISSLLPLVVVPVCTAMKIGTVASFYGQQLLFFLIGVLSLGRAVEKYGLGKRIAICFLGKSSKSGSVYKVLASFLIVVAVISAFVDDAATIAICLPIGMSIVSSMEKMSGEGKMKKLSVFMALGVLYASEAGGIMSVAGIPHIAVALSVLEKTTGISVSFLQWSSVGIIIGTTSLIIYFLILAILCKPEIKRIDNAVSVFETEKEKLGKMSTGEKNVIFVFLLMLLLWLLPSFINIPFLNVWIVPVIGTIALYLLPDGEASRLLTAEDFSKHLPWNIIFLVIGGGVMASLSTEFGVVEYLKSLISTDMSAFSLMLLGAFSTAGMSNFISGSATVNIMSNIFMPIASAVGMNPMYFAYILPASGMAILLPWAGAATGCCFSSGRVTIKEMVKCGFVATVVHLFAVIIIVSFAVPVFFR